jgi:hypothetical protein
MQMADAGRIRDHDRIAQYQASGQIKCRLQPKPFFRADVYRIDKLRQIDGCGSFIRGGE